MLKGYKGGRGGNGDSTTVDYLFKHYAIYIRQREYHKDMCKMEGGLLFRGPSCIMQYVKFN